MQTTIKDGGRYRIKILDDYELKETEGGALMLKINATITHEAGSKGEWEECEPAEVSGFLCLFKKDGNANAFMIEALMTHTGWDGNLETIGNKGWRPTPCACTTQRREYKGDVRYQINFINSYDAVPTMGSDRIRELQQKYAGQLSALGGQMAPMVPPPSDDADIPF